MKVRVSYRMGKRIRKERELLGMSLEKVAELMNITPGYYGLIECGQRELTFEELEHLMGILKMDWDGLTDKECYTMQQNIINSLEQLDIPDLEYLMKISDSLVSQQEESQKTDSNPIEDKNQVIMQALCLIQSSDINFMAYMKNMNGE